MSAVLIVGASRGLGLEFVRQYSAAGTTVVATARSDDGLAAINQLGASALKLDVADPTSVSSLARQLDGRKFNEVIIVAGVAGPRDSGLQMPTAQDFDEVMHTNVLGPMCVLSQLQNSLAPGARLAIVSSRMGSISLRASTRSWLYCASKAAVNSVLKDASLALQGKAICVSVHPGWVSTDMGGAGADIAPATSVSGMRSVLASLEPEHNGSFFNYDGKPLAW